MYYFCNIVKVKPTSTQNRNYRGTMKRKFNNTSSRRRMHNKTKHLRTIKRQKLFFNFLTAEN